MLRGFGGVLHKVWDLYAQPLLCVHVKRSLCSHALVWPGRYMHAAFIDCWACMVYMVPVMQARRVLNISGL